VNVFLVMTLSNKKLKIQYRKNIELKVLYKIMKYCKS